MRDPDANFEVASVSARGLDSTLNNYAVSGTYYAVTTDDENDELGTLYVILSGAAEDPDAEVAEKVEDAIDSTGGAWGATGADGKGTYSPVGTWKVDEDDASKVNASYYNKFGQESRAASPAFFPSHA